MQGSCIRIVNPPTRQRDMSLGQGDCAASVCDGVTVLLSDSSICWLYIPTEDSTNRQRGRAFAAAMGILLSSIACMAEAHSTESDVIAMMRYEARAFEHGEGVPKDPQRAVALYCQASRLGDAEAMFSLGWIYANGRGVERNDALAAYFFSKAAKQGHVQAARMQAFVGEPPAETPDCMRLSPVAKENAEEQQDTIDDFARATGIVDTVRRLSAEYGVSTRLALAVIRMESNFDPKARSSKNAQGLMQLIPDTAKRFNVAKPFDVEQNIRGGLAYLRWLLAYFEGDVALVAAGYNAGEGAVDKYRGIPPYAETRAYVQRVVKLYGKNTHPFDPLITERSAELSRFRQIKLSNSS